MAWYKYWPVWSKRTGSSSITTSSVDPWDDQCRIYNCTTSYIDPDTDPVGHASAQIMNYPTQQGNPGKVFPHSVNPLRTLGQPITFAGCGFPARRCNNTGNNGGV